MGLFLVPSEAWKAGDEGSIGRTGHHIQWHCAPRGANGPKIALDFTPRYQIWLRKNVGITI